MWVTPLCDLLHSVAWHLEYIKRRNRVPGWISLYYLTAGIMDQLPEPLPPHILAMMVNCTLKLSTKLNPSLLRLHWLGTLSQQQQKITNRPPQKNCPHILVWVTLLLLLLTLSLTGKTTEVKCISPRRLHSSNGKQL